MKYRLTKIYTRTGDQGMTGLARGGRVRKDSARIEAYGSVDELSAVIGLVRAFVRQEKMSRSVKKELDDFLGETQHELFDLGADLASAEKRKSLITEEDVGELEQHIDTWQKELKPLREFILRNGDVISSWLHLACTVARRGERAVVRLANMEKIDPVNIKYLNRLNDALFVLARWVGNKLGEEEVLRRHKSLY